MSETSRTLSAKFCRIGLNRLWVLKMDNGIQDAVTHIGLGRGLYTPTGEETQLKDEFLRVPVLDSYEVSASQYAYYATALLESLPAGKLNEPVGEIAFFLSDGTILAIYSSSIPETYLTIGVLARLIYNLKIDAVPAGSLTFTNTQIYFNPGIQEIMGAALAATAKATVSIMQQEQRLADMGVALDAEIAQHAADVVMLDKSIADAEQRGRDERLFFLQKFETELVGTQEIHAATLAAVGSLSLSIIGLKQEQLNANA